MSAGRLAFEAATDVSRETIDRLAIYANLLEKWNQRINLVSRASMSEVWERHFLDSAQLLKLVAPGPLVWADFGSGGGFPGAVIAIMNPNLSVTLVESDQRKAAFLRTVSRQCGAAFNVESRRIEDLAPLGAGVVSARALAPLPELLRYADLHLAEGGTALFPKGASFKEEIRDAQISWSFTCEAVSSTTDPNAKILKIGGITRV